MADEKKEDNKKSGKENSKREKEHKEMKEAIKDDPKEAMKETPKEMTGEPAQMPAKDSNPWVMATFIFLILAIILGVLLINNYKTPKIVSKDIVSQEVTAFVKNNFGVNFTLDSIEEKEDHYELSYKFSGRKFLIYATKDAEFIRLPSGNWVRRSEINGNNTQVDSNATETTLGNEMETIPKSAKPKVELFVMSLCPYALQAEKGMIPAIEALGSKVDFKIRFMHYILEGAKEDEENTRQLCIREEQNTKFTPYLKCYLNSGNSETCISTTGIDSTKLANCMKNKGSQYYLNDSTLSKSYGIEASPTLIINGKKGEFSPRSAKNALAIICSAFTTQPAECNQELSSDNPTAAFGTGTDDKNFDGYCG